MHALCRGPPPLRFEHPERSGREAEHDGRDGMAQGDGIDSPVEGVEHVRRVPLDRDTSPRSRGEGAEVADHRPRSSSRRPVPNVSTSSSPLIRPPSTRSCASWKSPWTGTFGSWSWSSAIVRVAANARPVRAARVRPRRRCARSERPAIPAAHHVALPVADRAAREGRRRRAASASIRGLDASSRREGLGVRRGRTRPTTRASGGRARVPPRPSGGGAAPPPRRRRTILRYSRTPGAVSSTTARRPGR